MIKQLTKDELQIMKQGHEDFVLIHVLSRESFCGQHIHPSVNIPQQDRNFVDIVEKFVGSKKHKIVLYCSDFECDASTEAAEKLEYAGFSNIYDYEGGVKDWFSDERQAA